MKIIAIVQARMGSSRLPGKAVMDICGEPMLVRLMNRLQKADNLQQVIIATTVEARDDVIVNLCNERGYLSYRGSEDDVLDRYYKTAVEYGCDACVRITSDCPLIDVEVVDKAINIFKMSRSKLDYVSTSIPHETFPRGLDTEVIAFSALYQAWNEDSNPKWREHVTPYIYRNPERFVIRGFDNDFDYSKLRWTVDTPEDARFVMEIYNRFPDDLFSWHDILDLLNKYPELIKINQHVVQKQLA